MEGFKLKKMKKAKGKKLHVSTDIYIRSHIELLKCEKFRMYNQGTKEIRAKSIVDKVLKNSGAIVRDDKIR